MPIPDLDSDLTSGEARFLDQYTRRLMVQWCHDALANKRVPIIATEHHVYRDYAITKKWLSAKDGKVMSAGWAVAAAFLKR